MSLWSRGAWWYGNCRHSNVNGKYLGEKVDVGSVKWLHFKNKFRSLKCSEMKPKSKIDITVTRNLILDLRDVGKVIFDKEPLE